ncbi:MAG: efflux RND transporter permease subunit [Bryobacteraceae bacterium]
MKMIDSSIRFPVTTAVAVILLVLFGALALFRIPVQLTPTVDRGVISVTTMWPGASPQEVERQIVQEQEEQLKSIENLDEMESVSSQGQGQISLMFQVGTDMQEAMLAVANRLEQVPRYPDDALKPVIRTAGSEMTAIAWFHLRAGGAKPYEGRIDGLLDFADDFIRPEFERVAGVGQARLFGGRAHEMHFVVDPAKLAARRISITQLAASLQRENSNFSGGDFIEGKNRYVVRTVSEYSSPEEIENIVIGIRDGIPVYARDVGHATLALRKATGAARMDDEPGLAVNISKTTGANTLVVMEGLKEAAARLNRDLLAPHGLELVQFYDETDYIVSAIDLVRESLVYGGMLAGLVLFLFLRSLPSTLIVAVAMPISVMGAFLMMFWLDRSLNVISLAGLAFAVGMVVDNCIVTLENIYRHRQLGKKAFQAAYDGVSEVWGAVLASTLTTVAVFVPIVFVQEEAGQLFRDIAIAISCAVGLSLLVSITVIPSLSARYMRVEDPSRPGLFTRLTAPMAAVGGYFGKFIAAAVYWICGRAWRSLAVAALLATVSIGLSLSLMPKVEYLPTGNRNFVFGQLIAPPGYHYEEVMALKGVFDREIGHLWNTPPDASAHLPGGGVNFPFFVANNGSAFLGGRARDPVRAGELVPEFQKPVREMPGAIGAFRQASIFQVGPTGGDIQVNIAGPDFDRLRSIGAEVMARIGQAIPGAQAAPAGSIDAGVPEVQVIPDRKRAAEAGVSSRDLGFMVSALIDGVKATDYQWEGKRIDLKIVGNGEYSHRTHLIRELPVVTSTGRIVPVGSVADIRLASGPVQISHRERQRVVGIRVVPPQQMPLEAVMDGIRDKVIQPLQQEGIISGVYRVTLSGSADKLTQTWEALRSNFLLALVITYLLMSALFESFVYPFVILFSVPLATLGGFLGLAVVNRYSYQPLDVLTMLGFFILVGTVVNNAILIVHQALIHIRQEGLSAREATREATSTRVRPIFMSVLTSVFGMLPLVLFPGPGSELYRGVGSVVVGGLILSTVFTLFVVPAVFNLTMQVQSMFGRWFGRAPEASGAASAAD